MRSYLHGSLPEGGSFGFFFCCFHTNFHFGWASVVLLPKDVHDDNFDDFSTGDMLVDRLGDAEPVLDICPLPNPPPPTLSSQSSTNGSMKSGQEPELSSWQYVEKLLQNFDKSSAASLLDLLVFVFDCW